MNVANQLPGTLPAKTELGSSPARLPSPPTRITTPHAPHLVFDRSPALQGKDRTGGATRVACNTLPFALGGSPNAHVRHDTLAAYRNAVWFGGPGGAMIPAEPLDKARVLQDHSPPDGTGMDNPRP